MLIDFDKADALLKALADPVEQMKLDFGYGRTLFRLSRGRDLLLAVQARDRLASALALARSVMPALVPPGQLESALADAEKTLRNAESGLALVMRSIWDHLCSATHLIADLTKLNPNVALELGIAHTLGRNVLLISQDDPEQWTFPHLAKQRVHRYALKTRARRLLRGVVDQFLAGTP